MNCIKHYLDQNKAKRITMILKRLIFFAVCFLLLLCHALLLRPQENKTNIAYRLSWDQANSHLLNITMEIVNPTGDSLHVSIPAWRPGRYIIQNYTKNVINLQAFDEAGRSLLSQKIDKDTWRIPTSETNTVIVKYDYYARHLDGGSSYLDDSEAYINPITCLMYIPGKELLPVSLSIDKPADWNVATALQFDEDANAYVSPNYHELVDAPILISPSFKLLTFETRDATFEIALQGEANYEDDRLIEDIRKIVEEQIRIMQDLPFKRYLFIYHFVPYRFGHGVEHKNSTSIVLGPPDFDDKKFYRGFLGVTSHEFFHAWNVERIRPEAIYLPDYSKENYSTTLWTYEGMTSYYGHLTLVRTHLVKRKKYLENWASIIKRYQNTYGRKVSSVVMVSWDSWTKSMGHAPPNTYYSFYMKGNILGMMLDLEIRHRTENKKSLDGVMHHLNEIYAKQGRGVPEKGLQKAIEQVADSDFEAFFADHVNGTAEIDYNRYLQYAGLELVTKNDEKSPNVHMGIRLSGDEKKTIITNVKPESPAFEAGLDIEDVLLAIDGKRAYTQNIDVLLKQYAPGDTIRVTVFRRDKLRHFDVKLAEAPPDKYEIKELQKPSELQLQIRKAWLNEETEAEEKEVEE